MANIYFYGVDNNYGGMENYAYNLISKLHKNFHFHILSCFENFAYKKEFVDDFNCSYTILPKKNKKPFSYIKELKALAKQSKPNDILQINAMSYRNFLLFHSIKRFKGKIIIVGHAAGTNSRGFKLLHTFNRFLYKNLGKKIAITQEAGKYMFKNGFDVISNGIDAKKFIFNKVKRDELREKYNIKNDDIVLGQVGRICKIKNQEFTSNLIETLPDNFHLFVIGKTESIKIKKCLQNKKNIHLIDQTKCISDFYNMFDITLFPSKKGEGAGLVMYESLANGCPCIVSDQVPKINVNSDKLNVLPLKIDLWSNLILNTLFNSERKNLISETEYDIIKQSIQYKNLYQNIFAL